MFRKPTRQQPSARTPDTTKDVEPELRVEELEERLAPVSHRPECLARCGQRDPGVRFADRREVGRLLGTHLRPAAIEGADEVVALWVPPEFGTVGRWYADFGPIRDADVLTLLQPYAPELPN